MVVAITRETWGEAVLRGRPLLFRPIAAITRVRAPIAVMCDQNVLIAVIG